MKKLITGLIIIIGFGVAALVIGFIHIPPDRYGIIYTKINGFEEVIEPDTRLWRWEKLLPTVTEVYTFDLSPYSTTLQSPLKGSLYPSGEDYAEALGESFNFTFEFNVYVEISIKPEELRELVVSGLRPDAVPAWYRNTAEKLGDSLGRIVMDDPDLFMEYEKERYIDIVRQNLSEESVFNAVRIHDIVPKSARIPDMDAYTALKENYLRMLEAETDARIELINTRNERNLIAIRKEIDIIQNIDRYAEIIARYPAVIEFLRMRDFEREEIIQELNESAEDIE